MYYHVRETCGQKAVCYGEKKYSLHASGFAKEIEFSSELLEGKISIDGLHNIPIYWGQKFRVSSSPETALKSLKFMD